MYDLTMDYEEIHDMQRFRSPYVRQHYEREATNMTTAGSGAPRSLSVGNAGGLSPTSPSASVQHVDPALYSKVIRRCSPTHSAFYHGRLTS